MKLIPQRELHIENIIKRKLSELTPKYRSEIERVKTEFYLPATDRKREILNLHTAHMQEVSTVTVEAYLLGYRIEEHMPDDNDIVEIVNKLSYRLNKELGDCVLHLPLSFVFSGETQTIIHDALSNAHSDFLNARTETELAAKRKEEERMNEKLILEKEQKRYRVLKRIYVESGGNPMVEVSEDTIIEKERISAGELVNEILRYLAEEHLIRYARFRTVAIDHLGIREIEDSVKHPNRDTEHFQSTIIQHFHAPVHNVQTGNQNTQIVTINISPDFNEAVSKLLELLRSSTLGGVQRDDAIEALERLPKLAQQEKTADVIEAATKRLTLVKTAFEVVKLSAQAAPYVQYLYHWFQG